MWPSPSWRWRLLLLLLLSCLRTSALPPDSFSQLAAPQHPKLHLYNKEQVLSWESSSSHNDTRPVVYRVQFKFMASLDWYDVTVQTIGVNCTRIPETQCNFTEARPGFPWHFNVTLQVRAELGEIASAWTPVPWFQYYQNVTIGPPTAILVSPGAGSLLIRLSSPFDLPLPARTKFLYYIHYREEAGISQVKGPVESSSIFLDNLKPLKLYCLQAEARLSSFTSRPGHLSNTSCYETIAEASTKVQNVALISAATFLVLLILASHFLFLKYKSQVKYWFRTPPRIPSQIEEYLKDPALPILEVLDKDSSPEDAWDSVSVISLPEKEDVPQTLESEH
ncbi:interferon gamma receptor 2 [Perognathus longimembris pacificus]|uniref:interferon gamma receptor 2 n=1 Tax=Perognathus longimembris pacificus TaxID=214514 RepID=UPI00201A0C95|nr:interferon gamma receptor 2 [Perognathus longimembris pacificus]